MSESKSTANPLEGDAPLLPSEVTAAANERPCPECGEKVRTGLVRCWNCGAFLKKEIEQKYAEMQAKPARIIFSELPEGEAVAMGDVDDDTGFELSGTDNPLASGQEDSGMIEGYQLQGLSGETDAKAKELSSKATAETAATAKKSAAPTKARKEEPEAGGVAHSVATAGDVLLEVAMDEEREQRTRRKQRGVSLKGGVRTPGGFIIYCPYGCRIEVKDQHRGMTGQCPKCRAPFIVPVDPPDYGYKERAAETETQAAAASPTGAWSPWFTDQRLHTVAPEKLKLKAGSLAKDFAPVDVGFGPEGLLLVGMPAKKGGLFGGKDKGAPDPRTAIQDHLKEGKPVLEVPGSNVRLISRDDLAQVRVAQPAANPAESMFAGIPVFGEHQIAVQLPLVSGQPPQFLSFGITGFRAFATAVRDASGGIEIQAPGVPKDESYTDYTCHYSDVPVRAINDVAWYQADPASGLVLAGWKCAACGLVVSEDARKKEGLGGKAGKGIAKAKCPKCSNKFGEQPLYTLPSQVTAPTLGDS